MNKQELIDKFLAEPIKIGDMVDADGVSTTTEVVEVHADGSISIHKYGYREPVRIKSGHYQKSTYYVGANPFPEKPWNSNLRMISYSLESIVRACGYEKSRCYKFDEKNETEVQELNWNPFVIDKKGDEVIYQRDFCWTLEQKQLLIESIYNNIDIGKIVVRNRSFDWVRKRVIDGKNAAFRDIVDGKQRLNAIMGFIYGEFSDLHGNNWEDLSRKAQNTFFNFMSVAYGEIGENATDEDVKAIFLNVNFAGVQMSQEHIDFVKSIQL